MAYAFIESRIMGKQSIASGNSTAAAPVGTIVRAKDPTLGEGEFIYLQTTASVKTGAVVYWTTRSLGSVITKVVPSTANNAVPIAVAMCNGVTKQFAWFAISGTVPVLKQASLMAVDGKVFISTTTGRIRSLSSTGRNILGMRTAASTSAGVSTLACTFTRPHLMGT